MYVCVCNAVTENAIREAVDNGVRSLAELRLHTGCSMTCGTCRDLAEAVLRTVAERRGDSSLFECYVYFGSRKRPFMRPTRLRGW